MDTNPSSTTLNIVVVSYFCSELHREKIRQELERKKGNRIVQMFVQTIESSL